MENARVLSTAQHAAQVQVQVQMAVHQPAMRSDQQRRRLLAGGGAGVVAKTACAPLERVKIVCQTGESIGLLQTTRTILWNEGVLGFWRGNCAACVRIIPHKAMLFAFTDMYKDLLRHLTSNGVLSSSSSLVSFVAGSMSGFTASVCTYPLDFIRTRLAGTITIGNSVKYLGIYQTFKLTIHEEGFRALYRGIGPTLVGTIPYEGIKFGSYDLFKKLLPANIDPKADFLGKVVCGGGAGLLATIVTYPNDTVRRRLQMQGAGGSQRLYKHAVDCYVQLVRQHGVGVLYRGLAPTLVRALPNMGIQFASYECFKTILC